MINISIESNPSKSSTLTREKVKSIFLFPFFRPTDSEFQRIRSTSQVEPIPIDTRFARPFNSIHYIRRIPIVPQPLHLIPTGTISSAQLNMSNSSNQFHQELSLIAPSSPSISIQNWSVSDVAQFIDRHFPDKNIAQVKQFN